MKKGWMVIDRERIEGGGGEKKGKIQIQRTGFKKEVVR